MCKLFFEHEINGAEQKYKADEILKLKGLLHHENGENAEYHKCYYFLRYFQLESGHSTRITQAVGWDSQAIFHQGDKPAYNDCLP